MADPPIRTARLELTDSRGRVRAVLTCDDDSSLPTLSLLDAAGTSRVIVGLAWNEMPQIQLTAPDGTARVALVVRPEGGGLVVVTDDGQRTTTIGPAGDP